MLQGHFTQLITTKTSVTIRNKCENSRRIASWNEENVEPTNVD